MLAGVNDYFARLRCACEAVCVPMTQHCIYVSIGEQKLSLFEQGVCSQVYDCKSSKNPPSCIEDSLGTPLGLHRIAQKIGDNAPVGMVFKGRVATGKTFAEYPHDEDENKVTSRILWLDGLEPNKNAGPGCDSFKRYIYIHGTNQEAHFEHARSHGCILLRNHDVIALYERIALNSLVLIE